MNLLGNISTCKILAKSLLLFYFMIFKSISKTSLIGQNSSYTLREVENKSKSGAVFKLASTLSPFIQEGTQISDYEYQIIVLEPIESIESFTSSLETKLSDDFKNLLSWCVFIIVSKFLSFTYSN